jgi:serine/threonine protein kinase
LFNIPPMETSSADWTVGNYSIVGSSGFGLSDTFIAVHNLVRTCVCIKRVPLSSLRDALAVGDVPFLCGIMHQNITEVFEVIKTDNCLNVVFSLATVSLNSIMTPNEPLSEDAARSHFRQIAHGVAYLHLTRGIVHGSLTMDSVLFDAANDIQLSDVGLARLRRNKVDDTMGTSPEFIAPEVLLGMPYGMPADIWSLGVLLYFMVTGRSLFPQSSMPRVLQQICSDEPAVPMTLSDELRDLVHRLLAKAPENRITIDRIIAHPWLAGPGGCSVESQLVEVSLNLLTLRTIAKLGVTIDPKAIKDTFVQGRNSPQTACYRILRRQEQLTKQGGRRIKIRLSSVGNVWSVRRDKPLDRLVGHFRSFRCRSVSMLPRVGYQRTKPHIFENARPSIFDDTDHS